MQNNSTVSYKEILKFIKCFDGTQYQFLNGCCYWFSHILNTRFGGITFYELIDAHFVQKIEDRYFDVRGDVTELYQNRKTLVRWDEYKKIDSTHYKRIVNNCILMNE